MPSILPGFEYDIFISYRHNDNLDGWVTEFVQNLEKELRATLKDSLTIYFDKNPHDGLLETHNVDKSLEGKLKCLIFIPILSQTYCDTKSFAWQHEFVAFNKLAQSDQFDRDIKLKSGNVSSRILPIQIHELDAEDKALVEKELGSMLRSVEFIYQTAGVVRPLLPNEEDAKGNLKHTFYRDQMNKVVRGIKELITGMKNPGDIKEPKGNTQQEEVSVSARRKLSIVAALVMMLSIVGYVLFNFTGLGARLTSEPNKSIAVLPFENMNRDSTQDYFSRGMSEDILNHLVKIADLRVKSRTSTLQYKGTTKTASQIGEELNVANIVEGSVRRVGDQVRIVVQLIDAQNDVHLWSETYDRDFKDVLSLQSEIAIEIAKALQARLTNSEKQDIEKATTQNATAYDYYLKAREFRRRGNISKGETESALLLVNQSIVLDKKFSKAYALKAMLWFDISTFGVHQSAWYDSAIRNADYSIKLDATAPDGYLAKGNIHMFLGYIKDSNKEFEKAYALAPNNPEVLQAYGYLLLRLEKEEGADLVLKGAKDQYSPRDPEYYSSLANAYFLSGDLKTMEELLVQTKSLNPGALLPYLNLASMHSIKGDYDKVLEELKVADKINPENPWTYDVMAWTYFRKKDYATAAQYWAMYPQFESKFTDTTQTIPFRHRLAMTYVKLGRKKEGDKLVQEDINIRKGLLEKNRSMGTWSNFGSVYYDLAVDHAYLGNEALAVQCLDSAFHYMFAYYEGYDNDPAFENLKNREDFKKIIKKRSDRYKFLGKAFSNALNRSQASKELKVLLEK